MKSLTERQFSEVAAKRGYVSTPVIVSSPPPISAEDGMVTGSSTGRQTGNAKYLFDRITSKPTSRTVHVGDTARPQQRAFDGRVIVNGDLITRNGNEMSGRYMLAQRTSSGVTVTATNVWGSYPWGRDVQYKAKADISGPWILIWP
jgi:hypothetical protein